MAKKVVVKQKVKAKPVVKRKPRYDRSQVHVVQAVGRRHVELRNGAEGYEMELFVGSDSGDRHLATLVFEPAEAKKLRDGLVALVR
jgi:hypothetical protein